MDPFVRGNVVSPRTSPLGAVRCARPKGHHHHGPTRGCAYIHIWSRGDGPPLTMQGRALQVDKAGESLPEITRSDLLPRLHMTPRDPA